MLTVLFCTVFNQCTSFLIITQKLQNRLAALERSTISAHQKSKLMAVLTLDFMSSEESNDDSDDELEDTYIVRELPWRSSKVDDVFIQLDEETKRSMSKQSKRQQKKQIYSEEPSSRPIPSGKFPSCHSRSCRNKVNFCQ